MFLRYIIAAAILACALGLDASASDTVWSKIITDDGRHIGYTYRKIKSDKDHNISVNYSQMKIREKESKSRIYQSTTRYFKNKATGEIERIERTNGYYGYQNTIIFERFGDIGKISRDAGKRTVKKQIPMRPKVAIDNGASRIKAWDFLSNPKLEFRNLNLSAMAIETVIVERAPIQNPAPHILSLIRKTYNGSQLLTVNQFDIDKNSGDILTYEVDLLNRKIYYLQSDENDAKKGSKSFSVIQSSMIPSPHKISKAALNGNIRYRFSYKDDVTFELPESGEQKVVTAGKYIVLDICEMCGSSEILGDDERKRFLAPSVWIESDDPAIQKLASKVDKDRLSDHEKMMRLGVLARKKISTVDFVGHYSASDAMKRRRGDCGEDAVLLAALGRAAGIPTRVASGLVYSRARYHGQSNVFLPHIWTQAFIDGRWTTYDISLEGFDASHIVTSIGQGDPRSLASSIHLAKRLKWEDMVHVKPGEN